MTRCPGGTPTAITETDSAPDAQETKPEIKYEDAEQTDDEHTEADEAPESPEDSAETEQTSDEPTKQQKESAEQAKKQSRWSSWKERRESARMKREMPKSAKGGLKRYSKRARSISKRSVIVLVLSLLAVYMSCSATTALPIPASISYTASMETFYAVLIALAVLSLIAALDVVRDAVKAIFRLQIDFNTLVVMTVIVSIVHSAVRMVYVGEELAYPCVAMMALFFLMRARMAQAVARRNTYKSASLNEQPIGVYIHRGSTPYLAKRRMESRDDFVYSAARDGWYSRFERLYSPIAIVTAIVMAFIVSTAAKDMSRFPYVFSAMLAAVSQIGVLTAVAYGCANATRRLNADHAAIAGLSAAVRIADVPQVSMTEADLFPAGSISIDDYIDIRGAMTTDDVLAYAAALEGDTALGKVLKEKIRLRYGDLVAAHDLIHYANGSQARIADKEVLFGTAEFMEDRKILIPAFPNQDNHMFLAVDGKTAAVLEVEYSATTQVYTALQTLSEHKISILLQEGDCYLSDAQLCDLFGLKSGAIHRANAEQTRAMNDPEKTKGDDLLAILTRDGAAPYTDCVDTACSLKRLSGVGIILGVAAAVIDVLLMAYLCYVFAPLGASPHRVLLYSLLWAIPVFFVENEVQRG